MNSLSQRAMAGKCQMPNTKDLAQPLGVHLLQVRKLIVKKSQHLALTRSSKAFLSFRSVGQPVGQPINPPPAYEQQGPPYGQVPISSQPQHTSITIVQAPQVNKFYTS